jgi:hypothetical protein
MIRPIININGTSADDLIEPRIAAYDALQAAMVALQQVTPNGRDYPGDNDQCVADREMHYARLRQIKLIMAEIMVEALAIKEQIK